MPEIKFKHVVSCSSEDRNHGSDNLLKTDGTKKWQTATPGERQATVTLQFEKAEKIQGIDIGNNGAAFVEVLVAKSDKAEPEFQVILVASSFMSPLESKSGTNLHRVRMFGLDKLSNAAVDHKWDRVKIVCTQPFNKSVTYGLSFVKFFSEGNRQEKPLTPTENKPVAKLGAFKIKSEEESSDSIKIGSLFANRGKEKPESAELLTGAAAVRAASRLADEASTSQHTQPIRTVKTEQPRTPVPVKRKHEDSQERNEKKHTPASASSPAPTPSLSRTPTPSSGGKPSMRKQSTTDSSSSSKIDSAPPMKKSKSESEKTPARKPLNRLMSRVVFVLSGFQNPARGDIRDRALEMGAKYRPDWGQGCTHLVCAFANTPKFNAVNGKGIIVTKNWVMDCYKHKRLLPWRKYRLGDADSPSESSDDEEEERDAQRERSRTPAAEKSRSSTPGKSKSPEPPRVSQTPPKASAAQGVPDEADYAGSTDVSDGEMDSGEDTEDEIQKVLEEKQKSSTEKSPGKEMKPEAADDPYAASTDEEDAQENGSPKDSPGGLPVLPDYFSKKHFFLYGRFSSYERRVLVRHIVAFDGTIADYMSEKVSHVITNSDWDENFDQALSDNPSLAFVKPQWIYACNDNNKFIPHQRFVVVPP